MLRGALEFEADKKRAVLDNNEHGYFVDFFENDVKIGRIEYYEHDAGYAERAAENFIYDIFKKEDILKHIEQYELDLKYII